MKATDTELTHLHTIKFEVVSQLRGTLSLTNCDDERQLRIAESLNLQLGSLNLAIINLEYQRQLGLRL